MKWLVTVFLLMGLYTIAMGDDCIEPKTGKPIPCPVDKSP